jgi:hypothetical protein
VPSLAGNLAVAVKNHAADSGIGRGDTNASARQFQGSLHPDCVLIRLLIHTRGKEPSSVFEPRPVRTGFSDSGVSWDESMD